MKLLATLAVALTMVGCASPDYAKYAEAQVARSAQEAKRLDNIALIARESNDPTARIAAIITLSHAETKAQDRIEKPTNVIVEAVQAGAQVYGTWAQTLLGVLQLRKATTGISEQDAANAINILKPTLK